jgi:hypothetical protein
MAEASDRFAAARSSERQKNISRTSRIDLSGRVIWNQAAKKEIGKTDKPRPPARPAPVCSRADGQAPAHSAKAPQKTESRCEANDFALMQAIDTIEQRQELAKMQRPYGHAPALSRKYQCEKREQKKAPDGGIRGVTPF